MINALERFYNSAKRGKSWITTIAEVLMQSGSTATITNLFGNVGGTILNAFVVISCPGTLNGLMIAHPCAIYSLAVRGTGPEPKTFAAVDPETNMPSNAGILALLICGAWYFYFYGANLTSPIFGAFSFDSSELPIITLYALYIPMFIFFIKKERLWYKPRALFFM